MSIVGTLIDQARKRSGIASDSALAAHFGVHRQAVSKWRTGDAFPDEDHIAQMATMAGDDPVQWLVAIKAVRSDGAAGRAWAALAKRLGAVAATLMLGIALAHPGSAQAAQRGLDKAPTLHYAKWMMRVWNYYLGLLRLLMERLLQRQLVLPPAKDATA